MTVFAHIDGQMAHFSDAPGHPSIDSVPCDQFQLPPGLTHSSATWSDSSDAADHKVAMRVLRRLHAGENLVVSYAREDGRDGPWFDFLSTSTDNGKWSELNAIQDTYGCNSVEAIALMISQHDYMGAPGGWSHDLMDRLTHCGVPFPGPVDGIGWRWRATVASWALHQHGLTTHPVSHAMGYRDSVVARMEPFGMAFTPETPPQAIDALQAMRFFVDHVEVAAKVALDTPQTTTLHLKPKGLEPITFQNVRMSRDVRGLLVTLPTGGMRFYRDAMLAPGSGRIIHGGRDMPRRRIPFDLLVTMSHDMTLRKIARRENIDKGPCEVLDSFDSWLSTAP